MLPGSPKDNMAEVWAMVQAAYAHLDVKNQFGNLLLNWFTDPDSYNSHYPKLKGKAGEIKNLIGPMLWVWTQKYDRENDMHQNVRQLLELLLEITNLIDKYAHELFMSREDSKSLQATIDEFLKTYCSLCDSADRDEEPLWNMVPKFHWLWHLADRSFWLSPRRGACWIDETFVGIMKRIAAACVRRMQLHEVPTAIMRKWRWGRHADRLGF